MEAKWVLVSTPCFSCSYLDEYDTLWLLNSDYDIGLGYSALFAARVIFCGYWQSSYVTYVFATNRAILVLHNLPRSRQRQHHDSSVSNRTLSVIFCELLYVRWYFFLLLGQPGLNFFQIVIWTTLTKQRSSFLCEAFCKPTCWFINSKQNCDLSELNNGPNLDK